MELTILGAGPGMPQLDKHLSSILIRNAEQLLADCGDSCAHRLLEHKIEAEELMPFLLRILSGSYWRDIYDFANVIPAK